MDLLSAGDGGSRSWHSLLWHQWVAALRAEAAVLAHDPRRSPPPRRSKSARRSQVGPRPASGNRTPGRPADCAPSGRLRTPRYRCRSALVAHRDRYFDLLNAYQAGDARPLIDSFSKSSSIAATESSATASRLAEIPAEWRSMTGTVRRGSAASRLLETLRSRPIFSAEEATELTGAPTSRVYAAIDRLRDAGVLRP